MPLNEKSQLPFRSKILDLAHQLSQPFERVSLCYGSSSFFVEKDRWISSVTFWASKTLGLRITPFIYDVAHRAEVGSLSFNHVTDPLPEDKFFDFSRTSEDKILLEKMIIEEAGQRIESGVTLTASNDLEIKIVPNVMPYTSAFQCNKIELPFFEPEYSLDDYDVISWPYSPIR